MGIQTESFDMPKYNEGETKASQRSLVVTVRLSLDEKSIILDKSQDCLLSISSYMRYCAINGDASTSKEAQGKQNALILARLGFIMDSIRTQGETAFLDDLTRQLLAMRDECFISLGKQP